MSGDKPNNPNRLAAAAFFKPGAGFTLLEILIAIFIFSIVAATVFGSYRAVFGKAAIIEEGMRMGEMAQNCLNRIAMDLTAIHVTPAQIYKPPGLDTDPDPFRFVGEISASSAGDFPRVRFASGEHVSFGPVRRDGVAEIVYYVAATGEDRRALMRSDRLAYDEPFEENPADPILCEPVTALSFVYYDQEGDTLEKWDSDADDVDYATPRAVGVELEVAQGAALRRYKTTVTLPVYRERLDK